MSEQWDQANPEHCIAQSHTCWVGMLSKGWEMGLLPLPSRPVLSSPLWLHGNSHLENKRSRKEGTPHLWNPRQRSAVRHWTSSRTETFSLACHPTWTETCAYSEHACSHRVITSAGWDKKKRVKLCPNKDEKCLPKGEQTLKALFWYIVYDQTSRLSQQNNTAYKTTRC